MKKLIFFIVLTACLITTCIILLPTVKMLFIGGAALLTPKSTAPTITYGEFPFRIELEYDGERIIKEDTIICEYQGLFPTGIGPMYRKWDKWYGSEANEKNTTTLHILKIKSDYGEGYVNLYFGHDSAEYLMGDTKGFDVQKTYPQIGISANEECLKPFKDDKELLEHYGIKIISIEETPPIKNTFK